MANKFSIKTAIGLLVVLILGLGGIYIAYQVTQTGKKQDTRSKAANTANAELTFNKISDNTAEINIVPGDHKVTAVQLALKYDPAKIKINSLTNSTRFSNVLQPTFIDNVNGTASAVFSPITMADLSALQPGQTAEDLTLRLNAKVADVNFQLLSNGGTSINFDTETIVTSYNEENNVLKTPTTPLSFIGLTPTATATTAPTNTVTPTATATTAPTSTPTPTPTLPPADTTLEILPVQSIEPGQNITLDIKINPGTNIVSAVILDLTFPASLLEITELKPEAVMPGILNPASYDNTNGSASISIGINTGMVPVSTSTVIAKATFKAKSTEGTANISFSNTSKAAQTKEDLTSNVLSSTRGIQLSIKQPAANPTVKIKFRRMAPKDGDTMPVSVSGAYTGTVNFVSDANGVYSYTFTNLPIGAGELTLKPKFFLSKKFSVNLTNGTTTLDHTSTPFLGGDITSENSSQYPLGDNVINIFDYSLMVTNFSLTTPKSGHPADVDKDGYVKTSDYSEVTGNFNKKGE